MRCGPGKAKLYAEGRDPLTGGSIANKARDGRQTRTGQVFMAFASPWAAAPHCVASQPEDLCPLLELN